MRRVWPLFCALVFAAGIARADQPPNVLLILVDDLGWTDTSVQMDPGISRSKSDYHQTPNLEALASQGMRFSNFYSSAPVCSPTRGSIQTGKTPAQLHITDILAGGELNSYTRERFYHNYPLIPPMSLKKLPDEEITIAEYLKAGNPAYRASHHQKWDLVTDRDRQTQGRDVTEQGYDVANTGYAVFPFGTDAKQNKGATVRATTFIEESVTMGRPFFTQISYSGVHTPYEASQDLIDKYTALPRGQRHDQPLYAAMVEDIDRVVGDLLDKIDDLGISDNTYVIFTSDNGGRSGPVDGTQNDPLYYGKGTLWEGGIRVPMIVRGPDIEANAVSDVPAVAYDLFSTIGDMAGISIPEPRGVEGTTLLPILQNGGRLPVGETSLSRAHGPNGELFFHYPHYVNDIGEGVRSPASAIRDGDFKLVKLYGEHGNPDQIFLFDLSRTLTESAAPTHPLNLADDMPEKAAEMLGKLEHWLTAVDADLPTPSGSDFNESGLVDTFDLKLWDANYGTILAAHSQGDSNGDASIDGMDFLSWQRRFVENPPVTADFDDDHDVDPTDLAWWSSGYGANTLADANGDGRTDGADFLLWQQQSQRVAPTPGDFNGDQEVDGDDLAQWADAYGVDGDGDADRDGQSTGLDFLAWQISRGADPASVMTVQSVPEPSAIAMGGLALLSLLARRGRRPKR